MKIEHTNIYNYNSTFKAKGKPLELAYIVEKHADMLPKRVLHQAQNRLKKSFPTQLSLKEIHQQIYSKILNCTTLEKVKELFPEFSKILPEVEFKKDSVYSKNFKEKIPNNFALRMLQEFWGNLKSKKEVTESLGLKNRTSLDWALKKIGFISYAPNYLKLIQASDVEGNNLIASKTKAWNTKHPELMQEHNKHAAQAWKKESNKLAQAKRMKEYDKKHPERREKISENMKQAWAICPEIRIALAEFTKNETPYIKDILRKHSQGIKLTKTELQAKKAYYKRFWEKHPEYKKMLADAKRIAAKNKN